MNKRGTDTLSHYLSERTDDQNATLPRLLAQNASVYGDQVTAIREKAYGIWQKYTWRDYYEYVRKTAAGLASLVL